jgi:nucleoid-associated protein YgaU
VAGLIGIGLTVGADGTGAHAQPQPTTEAPEAGEGRPAGVAVMRSLEPAEQPAVAPAPPPDEHTWTIQPGDHLWELARQALAETGRGASDADVAAYVDAIAARNRSVLVVPDHPDLVYAGQVFVRPPLP